MYDCVSQVIQWGDKLKWNFDNERPIYVQLVEHLKRFIITGAYKTGEKIPSVRELAMESKVNPNTMQKALGELENEGLIYTERTNGKFVTNDLEKIKIAKEKIANENAEKYLKEMRNIGYDKKEAMAYLKGRNS